MDFGVSQLENTVTSVLSASQSLSKDIRFLSFFYQEPNYSDITVSVRNQMKDYLDGLIFPLTLVTDCALQFADDVAITPTFTLFGKRPGYYPYHFCVDDMTYEEWISVLKQHGSGFLPVYHVTTPAKSYDALIYSLPWTKTSYFYVCMNISSVRQALIAQSDLSSYYLTIENTQGDLIYTDLDNSLSDYYSVTQKTSVGSLVITIHIPQTVLTSRMGPLYYFLGLYLVLCLLVLIITVFIGSHLSSRPLVKIVNMLESNDSSFSSNVRSMNETSLPAFQYGFNYIQNKVQAYEQNLNEYRSTIDTQAKVLQARFLEKALHGSLATEKDFEQFFAYFPYFPESFCLVQMGLLEQLDNGGTIYADSLSLIQIYLQSNLPGAYLQQLSSSELLIIIDEDMFEESSRSINYLIENINREEPSYHAWALTSRFYSHPRSLPAAYWQLQDLYSRVSLESLSRMCSFSEHQTTKQSGFQMADVLNIHSTITYGNKEVALLKLQSYADNLNANNRSVFEMFRSILLCIKQEHAVELVDINIPSYHPHLNMYAELTETICAFCDELRTIREQAEPDPFTLKIREYIDIHFTEDDLCLTKLCEHFHCSSSKIQRAFSKEMNATVSAYIEKKRMELANELLIRGEDTVAEVARKCGFTNDNTFHKAYRRVFGHTPKSMKQG